MRRTALAFMAVTAFVAGCDQTAEPTGDAPPSVTEVAAAPVMPADAPPQEEVDPAVLNQPGPPAACRDEIGAEAAQRLVQRCIAMSPATRPPCNVANPCALIQGEIDRSCDMYPAGEARPAECEA